MKITGGKYKRKNIAAPGGGTHPMGERERLALFNMLGAAVRGAVVMDAYAGSGALGLEALSRGAKEVLFIEEDFMAMRTIMDNAMSLRIPEEQVAFYRGPVNNFYKKILQGRGTVIVPSMADVPEMFPREFDIIMADPPYDEEFNPKILAKLAQYLTDDGIVVLSHPEDEAPFVPGLECETTHKYAAAHLSVYRKLPR